MEPPTRCGLLNSRAQCDELLEGLRIVVKHDMLQGTPAQSTRPRECSDSFQLTKMSVTTWHIYKGKAECQKGVEHG